MTPMPKQTTAQKLAELDVRVQRVEITRRPRSKSS